jgi:hypothetical protein
VPPAMSVGESLPSRAALRRGVAFAVSVSRKPIDAPGPGGFARYGVPVPGASWLPQSAYRVTPCCLPRDGVGEFGIQRRRFCP